MCVEYKGGLGGIQVACVCGQGGIQVACVCGRGGIQVACEGIQVSCMCGRGGIQVAEAASQDLSSVPNRDMFFDTSPGLLSPLTPTSVSPL